MGQMLEKKVAMITGSGRGIGRATALAFAAKGAKVVVCDIDAGPAEETVADIEQAGGECTSRRRLDALCETFLSRDPFFSPGSPNYRKSPGGALLPRRTRARRRTGLV